jgi:hypothetical protein
MTAITIANLTQSTVEGTGVFDLLMRANKAHLEAEFAKGRIKGSEYATVYLGSLQAVMQTAFQYVLQENKTNQDMLLMEKQITLLQSQIDLANQQKSNLVAEAANIPKQGQLLDAQKAQVEGQTLLTAQQKTNLVDELLTTAKQRAKLDQDTANALAENGILVQNRLKAIEETAFITQKKVTETAQTVGTGIGATSYLGKQVALLDAQTSGFARDAEQKAAKIMADAYAVSLTVTDIDNSTAAHLSAPYTAAVIDKLKTGIGA